LFQRLLYCDVESKWKNYHLITFPGQSLSKTLEEAMDLSQDRLILEEVIQETDNIQGCFKILVGPLGASRLLLLFLKRKELPCTLMPIRNFLY
jgi:hypothetical protein